MLVILFAAASLALAIAVGWTAWRDWPNGPGMPRG